MFETPILLIIFNRPHTTEKVFEAIKNIRPAKLYIAADGPRNQAEIELCDKARKLTEDINWKCEIHRLYRDNNLGCKSGVSQAIDWFFENEEMGIILEDDCVPNHSFFPFCTKMLSLYKDDLSVKTISGSNFLYGKYDHTNDYFFINYTMIWGWATWKRAWKEVDWSKPFERQIIENKIRQSYSNKQFRIWISNMINHYNDNFDKTWDVHVLTTFLLNDGLSIIPSKNLVKNIGVEGTHNFQDSKATNAATMELQIDSFEKREVKISTEAQNSFMNAVVDVWMPKETVLNILKRKVIKILNA